MQPRNLLMYRPNATEAVSVSLQLCARSAKTSIKVSYNCTKQNMSKSPNNTNTNTNNNNSPAEVKAKIRKCLETPHCGVIRDQKWQGKLITKRWDDEDLSRKGCFSWLREWTTCPTHTIAGMFELYEQMLPTRLYEPEDTHYLGK